MSARAASRKTLERSRAPRATNLVSAAGTAVHGPCWEKAVRFGFVYQQPLLGAWAILDNFRRHRALTGDDGNQSHHEI